MAENNFDPLNPLNFSPELAIDARDLLMALRTCKTLNAYILARAASSELFSELQRSGGEILPADLVQKVNEFLSPLIESGIVDKDVPFSFSAELFSNEYIKFNKALRSLEFITQNFSSEEKLVFSTIGNLRNVIEFLNGNINTDLLDEKNKEIIYSFKEKHMPELVTKLEGLEKEYKAFRLYPSKAGSKTWRGWLTGGLLEPRDPNTDKDKPPGGRK